MGWTCSSNLPQRAWRATTLHLCKTITRRGKDRRGVTRHGHLQRRPRDDLYAHLPRGHYVDAGGRADRSDPLCRLRGVWGKSTGRSHPGQWVTPRFYGRYYLPKRQRRQTEKYRGWSTGTDRDDRGACDCPETEQ